MNPLPPALDPDPDRLVTFKDRASLLASLADDLQSPVAALGPWELGHDLDAELYLLRLLLDRLADGYDEHVLAAARHQVVVVQDVLHSATRPPRQEPVDLEQLAQDVTAAADLVYEGCLLLETEGPAVVLGDAALLRRVVVNLVNNARAAARRGLVRVHVYGSSRLAFCGVEDDGSSADNLRRGRGLGLRIVRSVAELHGGAVVTERSPLGGRRVVLRFPAAGAR